MKYPVSFKNTPVSTFKSYYRPNSNKLIINNLSRKSSVSKNSKLYSIGSIISPDDPITLWSAVAISSAIGLQLEKRTDFGKQLSGPVCAMLISAILTNIGVFPATGSVHISSLQSFVVKLATPLLLMDADLRKVYKDSGKLLGIFLVGSLGTVIGSVLGFATMRPYFDSSDSASIWKLIGALTAKNIGGGLNFVAVADALHIPSQLTSIGLAVDNILGLLYFPFVGYLGMRINNIATTKEEKSSNIISQNNSFGYETNGNPNDITGWCSALALCFSVVAVSDKISNSGALPLPAVILSTIITVFIATVFPKQLATENMIYPGGILGKLLLLLFFGSIGTSVGNISDILKSPLVVPLLGYGVILYSVHFGIISSISRLLFQNRGSRDLAHNVVNTMDERDILIASNANIGNAATASAFATTMGWSSKVVPAILVGTIGNSIGTIVGYWLAVYVLKYI